MSKMGRPSFWLSSLFALLSLLMVADGAWASQQGIQLVSVNANKCLDDTGFSLSNGTVLQQWSCVTPSQKNQTWNLVSVGSSYQIISAYSGKCADVTGVSKLDGAKVQQWTCIGPTQTNQLWNLIPVSGGYQVVSVNSGKCLDVTGASLSNGAQIQQWTCLGADHLNQVWKIVHTDSVSPGYTNYYIDNVSGSDSYNGTSESTPWKSLQRVSQEVFAPGDHIYFKRGDHFLGALLPKGSGSSSAPIVMSAYGSGGSPIIDGQGAVSVAFQLTDQQYWEVNSLNITGGQRFGVFVTGTQANTTLYHIHLSNLTVHDIRATPRWDSGLVMVAPLGAGVTFNDVLIDGVTAYNSNLWYGIHVGFNINNNYPTNPPLSHQIVIRNSTVHDVYGDGITVAQSQNVLIEHNTVWNTGLAPSGISYTPNGIWSWQCDHTTVQWNEGYATHSYSYDGGVFDIDWGSTNTLVQYNYAHDADGYCVAVMGAHSVTTSNSVVRFNVCSNNGRKSGMGSYEGGIFITTFSGGSLNGIQVYNNTAYWNPTSAGGWIHARGISISSTSKFIMNNVIYSTSQTLIDMDATIPIDRNLYWVTSGTPLWKYGSVSATSLSSLRSATGSEINGIFSNPALSSPTYHGTGWPSQAFELLLGSPARRSGATWSGMGSTDIGGLALPTSGDPDRGAVYSGD